MLNIYQLSDDYLMLADKLADTADEDGVVDESLLPVVSEAKELVKQKGESIGGVIKTLSARKSEIDIQIERLKQMSDVLDSRASYLKNALSEVLQRCGIERIDGVHSTISFRASEQTVIDDESELPEEYIVTKIETKPDKTKIKNAIKSGAVIPGAHIESKRNLQIK